MKTGILSAGLLMVVSMTANADVVDNMQASYRDSAAKEFSAAKGQMLWQQAGKDQRSCAACHGTDLRQPGEHATTHKVIRPMAPSVNNERLKEAAKIEKWFLRNCKWTWGRECSAQEKGDLLQYLRRL